MRYKITIQSLTDETDHFELEGDAIVAFVGKTDLKAGTIEHGMMFSGNKQVMAEVLASIPQQVMAFAKEQNAKAQQSIVTADGKDIKGN